MVYFKFGRRTITTSGRLRGLLDGGHRNGLSPLRPQDDDEETISIGEERILIGHRQETALDPGIIWAPFIPILDIRFTISKKQFKFGK